MIWNIAGPMPKSELLAIASNRLERAHLPAPILEHRFHPLRKWRFDLAWLDARLAVELEGGIWVGGRHTRGLGYQTDAEKYNAAQLAGWRVLRYTGRMIERGDLVRDVALALGQRQE